MCHIETIIRIVTHSILLGFEPWNREKRIWAANPSTAEIQQTGWTCACRKNVIASYQQIDDCRPRLLWKPDVEINVRTTTCAIDVNTKPIARVLETENVTTS